MYLKNNSLNKDHCTDRHWPWEGKRYVRTPSYISYKGKVKGICQGFRHFFLKVGSFIILLSFLQRAASCWF